MYLKSLQLIGFKSFVEKTTLEFLPGVGAIVGPNGCGKSNISDAIRWVLGEQSAKALRGGEMTDVIFNGTDGRKPIGMAEVSLTVGDAEKELGLGYTEVTITRRVFRDGKGEYFLNKTPCRLKDVQQLFMDTGIGRASYWLMEQGKIDRILSARPEDRRAIFEEAAGITKYKAQKQEALNKLELTNRNLEQLDPLLKEIKRQIISLQRQAGKARRYKELCLELKTLETRLARHQYDALQMEITSLQSQVDAFRAQIQEATRSLEADEEAITANRSGEQALERQLADVERQQLEIAGEIRRNEDLINHHQTRIAELATEREQRTVDLGLADEKIRAQQQQVLQAEELLKKQKTELTAAEVSFQEQNTAVKQADDALQGAEKAVAELKNLAVSTEQRLSQLRNERAELEQQRLSDTRRSERLAAERATLEERLRHITQKVNSYDETLRSLKAAVEQPKSDFETCQKAVLEKLEAAREPRSDLAAALKAIQEALQKATLARARWFEAEIAWAEKRGEAKFVQSEKEAASGRLETVSWEWKSLTEQAVGNDRVGEIERLLSDLAKSEEQIRHQLQSAEVARDQRAAERSSAQETFGQAKLALMGLQNSWEAARERKETATTRLTELRDQVARWQSEMGRASERATTSEQDIASARQAIEQLQIKANQLKQGVGAKREERDQAAATTAQLDATLRQKRLAVGQIQQQRNEQEIKLAEKNKDAENLTRNIQQRYQVDLTTLVSETAQGTEDWVALQDKVDELKIRLEEMGPVNTDAIQEYDELETRHREISQQQQDLFKARENLKEAIAKINATARQLFSETFERINRNFQEMFTELFGGGRASLRLLEAGEEGEDELEGGVEIMARPPGKHLQTVGLLSGGEKALTAIALIFAIYMVKPAPFCVFDELDAPLDESNIGRLCKVLERFLSQSQFILITHSKRTIAMAEVLYGVTMEESGVSKIVSVKFTKAQPPSANKEMPEGAAAKEATPAPVATPASPAS